MIVMWENIWNQSPSLFTNTIPLLELMGQWTVLFVILAWIWMIQLKHSILTTSKWLWLKHITYRYSTWETQNHTWILSMGDKAQIISLCRLQAWNLIIQVQELLDQSCKNLWALLQLFQTQRFQTSPKLDVRIERIEYKTYWEDLSISKLFWETKSLRVTN